MNRGAPSVAALSTLLQEAAPNSLQSELVQGRAEQLYFTLSMLRLNDLPRAQRNKRTNGRRDELHAIAMLAGKLYDKIGSAKGDTLAAIDRTKTSKHPLRLTDDLLALVDACCLALDDIATEVPHQSGARVKAAAAGAADLLLDAYEKTTTTKATIRTRDGVAYGPFLDFLAEGFKIVGIRASAEAQGKAAIRRRKQESGPLFIRTPMFTLREVHKEKTASSEPN
jgi:hypothetical protein